VTTLVGGGKIWLEFKRKEASFYPGVVANKDKLVHQNLGKSFFVFSGLHRPSGVSLKIFL